MKTGVALWGGGMGEMCGVLHGMEEIGLPVNLVAAAGPGAVAAVLFCAGAPPEMRREFCLRLSACADRAELIPRLRASRLICRMLHSLPEAPKDTRPIPCALGTFDRESGADVAVCPAEEFYSSELICRPELPLDAVLLTAVTGQKVTLRDHGVQLGGAPLSLRALICPLRALGAQRIALVAVPPPSKSGKLAAACRRLAERERPCGCGAQIVLCPDAAACFSDGFERGRQAVLQRRMELFERMLF